MDDELEFLRRVRRSVHRRPELGHREFRTAAFVERVISRCGLTPFRPAPTSVAVLIGDPGGGPVTGFRADLDALPITERNTAAYASRVPGVMHACGHDGHTAILLGLARRLAAAPPARPVLLVFQQAEESVPSGAPQVLEGLRALGPLITEFYGFHLWPELPAGTLGIRSGPVLAAVSGLVITVSGDRGRVHGTRCETEGVDALAAGVQLYQSVRAGGAERHPTVERPSTITLGQFSGGTAPNQTPTSCTILGTIRSRSWADEEAAVRTLHALASQVTALTGARIDVKVRSGIRPPVINHPTAVERVRAACRAAGVRCIEYPQGTVGVSDDFGWFTTDHPGAYLFLGCRTGDHAADLHQPHFDFDEAALLAAVHTADRLTRTSTAEPSLTPAGVTHGDALVGQSTTERPAP